MDGPKDIAALVRNIRGNDDSSRKLAAFHLQNLVGHDDFAQALVRVNGMHALCTMIAHEKGNTLAYALGSLNGILEKNLGWEEIGIDVAERAVQLVVGQAMVNVLRNALHFLVLIATRPDDSHNTDDSIGPTLETLKPILTEHPNLLDALVERLTSADHVLCANALRFLNALLQDALKTFTESQFMRFIKRLQDLDVYVIIEGIMRGDMTADIAGPVTRFHTLTKVMLRGWRSTPVDLTRPMHADALSLIQRRSRRKVPQSPIWQDRKRQKSRKTPELTSEDVQDVSWTSLGFHSEVAPTLDFEETGLLGLIDMTDLVQSHADFFQKTLLEQTVLPVEHRCPIARVSLSVTEMLSEHFGINHDGPFTDLEQPLLMSREKLHGAFTRAFFRFWDAAGATVAEYDKIEDLVRLMVARLLAVAGRHTKLADIESKIDSTTLTELRIWQIDGLERLQSDTLGTDLSHLTERLHEETMHFVREQRVQCLLEGAWFPTAHPSTDTVEADFIKPAGAAVMGATWRFVQLSPNRRYLHHVVVHDRTSTPPPIADMGQRINVNFIGSVVSSITKSGVKQQNGHANDATMTRLTIRGNGQAQEKALLELPCGDAALAAEWVDGLLMLLDQEPITADTARLVSTIDEWSLRIRLLNLQQQDIEQRKGGIADPIPRPEAEGEYWYDMGEG